MTKFKAEQMGHLSRCYDQAFFVQIKEMVAMALKIMPDHLHTHGRNSQLNLRLCGTNI